MELGHVIVVIAGSVLVLLALKLWRAIAREIAWMRLHRCYVRYDHAMQLLEAFPDNPVLKGDVKKSLEEIAEVYPRWQYYHQSTHTGDRHG